MIRLTKIFQFETAHALYGYTGKCKNIHGHSYKLHVTISGIPETNPESPTCGMVIDFTDLKNIVNKHIVDVLDHATLLNKNTPYSEIGDFLEDKNHKVEYLEVQPTCENMLYHFAEILNKYLPKKVSLEALTLYETETSYGQWLKSDNI